MLLRQPREYFPDGHCPDGFMLSRTAYENLLRFLVLREPNVHFLNGTVSAITPSAVDQGRLSGVKVRTESGEREVEADLVVGLSLRLPGTDIVLTWA